MRYAAYTENRSKNERNVVREYMRLAQHEPRLLELLNEIMAEQPTTWDWYSPRWKDRMRNLVGRARADHPDLGTSDAYDTVYTLCYSYCYDPPPRATA